MNFNKKNTTIVTSFSVLVIVVMSFVFYTSFQELEIQESVINTTSKNQGLENTKKRTYKLSTISPNTNPIIIKGTKIDFGNLRQKQQTNLQDNSTKKIDQIAKDLKTQPGNNLGMMVSSNTRLLEVVNNTPIQKTSETISDNNVNNPNPPQNKPQPILPQQILPPVSPIVPQKPQPVLPKPRLEPIVQNAIEEKTSYSRYERSMNILKARGETILIPIANNNIYQLDFSADSDINTVLSYEYDKNDQTKGYQSFGSNTHLRFLKCEAYIANCKSIIVRDSNGRYILALENVEYYI